MNNIIINTKIT